MEQIKQWLNSDAQLTNLQLIAVTLVLFIMPFIRDFKRNKK